MVSNHKLKEMLFFILLVVSGALSYIITSATNQEGLYYATGTFGGGGFNKGFIIEFVIILVVFILIFGFAAIMIGKRFSSSQNTNTSLFLY
jgi:magnesium-transporting ATPase (P-type)